MAEDDQKIYGSRWQVVRELGRGGQGIVYEVRRHSVADVSESVNKVQHALRNITATVPNKPETGDGGASIART